MTTEESAPGSVSHEPETNTDDNGPLVGTLLPMRPKFVEKVWGGNRLTRQGKIEPIEDVDVQHIGEAWEVADLKEGESNVAAGRFSGRGLGTLVREFGASLVGSEAPATDVFPLLVKLIDANDDLSVQVHPDAIQAQKKKGARSKDECWLVLQTDPGARLAHGFARDTLDVAGFRHALEMNTPEEELRFVEVKPGDVLRVSPGTVHAIGRGVFLLEVQEPSDTTYRVWDYARRGLDGNLRPLHVEDALDVLRFGPQPPALVQPEILQSGAVEVALLVDAPHYRLETLTLAAGATIDVEVTGETALVLVALEGSTNVTASASGCRLEPLHSLVVPAGCGTFSVHSVDGARVAVAGLSTGILCRSAGPAVTP